MILRKLRKLARDPKTFLKDGVRKRLSPGDVRIPTYVVGFSTWKQYLRRYFPDRKLTFIPRDITPQQFRIYRQEILAQRNAEIFIWGFKAPPFILDFVSKHDVRVKFVEDGFVRSAQLGATKTPPMSLCLDSRTPYFNARQPSDLEVLLMEYDFGADAALLERADALMQLLLQTGVSKYNNAAPALIHEIYGPKVRRRILVAGQVEDDASIQYGCEQPLTNNDVVRLAVKENPEAQVIYKPHPDVLNGHRTRHSDPRDVQQICLVLDRDIPLADALQTVDHLYTITSLAGLEALVRGIKVTTFGCPFYAGWGLTDDRQTNARRTANRTLRELIAGTYLLYPRYFDPDTGDTLRAEDVIQRLARLRALGSREHETHTAPRSQDKKAQDFVRIGPEWEDPTKPVAFLFSFSPWRYEHMASYLQGYRLAFDPTPAREREDDSTVNRHAATFQSEPNKIFVVLGLKDPPGLTEFALATGSRLLRVEDGFIRGIGLGAELNPPLSLAIDDLGMYFDARKPSRLETILNSYDFEADEALLARARACMKRLIDLGVSKYNGDASKDISTLYGPKERTRILVIGQVEEDASIQYGCSRNIDNNGLVMLAALENPDAEIIYKPHPDVIRGNRPRVSDPAEVESIARVITESLSIADALQTIDRVYTITSLSGFEALIRGIPVTTVGAPFYSGWGLTDDRQPVPRRNRRLSVEAVFAGAYLQYMTYRHPLTGEAIEFEEALDLVNWMRKHQISLQPQRSLDSVIARRHQSISKRRAKEQDFTSAYQELSQAIKLDPSEDEYYFARANALKSAGEVSDRIKSDYWAAVGISRNQNVGALKSLGNYIWQYEGVTKELRHVVELLMARRKHLSARDLLWIAAIYADAGYTLKALALYKKVHAVDPNLVYKECYLGLSYVVSQLEPTLVPNASRVIALYNGFEQAQGKFRSIVETANRSVAIVGNSPCEVGTGSGARIDAHDIVVRFNNYSTDYPHCDDYGTKTNVWIKAGFFDHTRRRSLDGIQLVIQPVGDLLYRDRQGGYFGSPFIEQGIAVELLPPDIRYRVAQKLRATPSSGILVLYWLYTLIGPLKRESVFGFNFVDQPKGRNVGYAGGAQASYFAHDWAAERALFDTLFIARPPIETTENSHPTTGQSRKCASLLGSGV